MNFVERKQIDAIKWKIREKQLDKIIKNNRHYFVNEAIHFLQVDFKKRLEANKAKSP